MRKTKIVCTLGPATCSADMIGKMVDAGMDVARINLSHGTQQEHSAVVSSIRQVSEDKGKHIAILMDLAGPKMRLGMFPDGPVTLKCGDKFCITTREVPGTLEGASITYDRFAREVKREQTILLADGAVRLKVNSTDDENVFCVVEEGGEISSRKGVNVTGASLDIPALTPKDRNDIEFAARVRADYIGLSFCHRPGDVLDLKQALAELQVPIPVIAKIEKKEAVQQIEEIIEVSDGVMVARGDLGVEIPIQEVPMAQKKIIRCANLANKPVMTATQMLSSMVDSSRPTRAETTDVANAILDGTDATMLSEETTIGKYPVDAVKMMSEIARCAEPHLPPRLETQEGGRLRINDAIGHSAATATIDLGAKAIVAFTRTGRTVKLMSRFRLPVPIVAITPSRETSRHLNLFFGVMPVLVEEIMSTDHMLEVAQRALSERGIIHRHEIYIVTAGLPTSESTSTNFMRAARL